MRCAEVELLLEQYLSDELDIRRRHQVEKHLQGCEACRTVLSEEQELNAALSDPQLHMLAGHLLGDEIPLPEPAPLPVNFTASIMQRLAAEGPASEQAEPEESVLVRTWRRMSQWDRQRWMNISMVAAAAAAIVFVWVGVPGVQTAVLQSKAGGVIGPVIEKADQLQASAVSVFATLKVWGMHLVVLWHQLF